MANLNAGIVARLRMPLPPAEEQGRIVKLVETENQRTERATTRLERQIELLREYRARLAADVVTGKLDVRGAGVLAIEAGEEAETEPDDAEPAEEGTDADD